MSVVRGFAMQLGTLMATLFMVSTSRMVYGSNVRVLLCLSIASGKAWDGCVMSDEMVSCERVGTPMRLPQPGTHKTCSARPAMSEDSVWV